MAKEASYNNFFAESVGLNVKVIAKSEFSQEFTLCIDIGDHPTVVTCLPIAAKSFKSKSSSMLQLDHRKA